MNLGERIKSLRHGKYTQAELGDMIGVHETTIRRWESNRDSGPKEKMLARLAATLNTTVAYLSGETDDPTRPGAQASAPAGQSAPAPRPPVEITVPLSTSDGQPGRIVYEWGGNQRLELPDTPENQALLLTIIKELAAAGHYPDSIEIEQDGQRHEYAKTPAPSPKEDGEISA